jgi:Flp pilus assembly protein TadD/chromosome segregation ATPase
MHRSVLFIIALGASLVMLSSAFSEESSDLFLKAYKDFQAAEKLEREAKPREALNKYRSAQQVLQQISKSAPDWQPLVVEYRLRKTLESVARLEGDLTNVSQSTEPPEGNLPEPDKAKSLPAAFSTEPVVTVKPPPAPKRTVREPTRAAPVDDNRPVGRGGLSVAEHELLDLRRQLAQAQAENEKVNERLLKKSADLQSALLEVDKTKVSVVELKGQLAQAASSLEDLKKDGVSLLEIREGLEKKYAGTFKQFSDLQTDNEVLQEENERLLAKLERAAKYIADSDQIRSGLLGERRELDDARDKALAKVKRIKDNSAEIEKVVGENKRLKSKLEEVSQNTVSKSEFEKLAAEKKVLTAKLEKATSDAAAEEKALIAKLEKATSDAAAEKDRAVASLQSDLHVANEKLLEAEARISRADEQLGLLRKELNETSGQLAQLELNPSDEKKLAMENELLRGIILRQIKEQTRRDDAKKLIEQEIGTPNANSDAIRQQLTVLGAPVLQLTPEERSVFKEPVTLLTETNAQNLEVTVAISKPGAEEVNAKRILQEPAESESMPENVRELVQRAKTLFQAKNYIEAEKFYQEIVNKIPKSYFALSNLGAVQIEGGKLSAAEVTLKKAVKINGNDSYAYTNLGIAYSRQGKFGEAIGVLHKAVAFNEEDAVAHNYLGVCLGQSEQWNEAEIQLKRAIELKPEYSDAHFNLAVLYVTTEPPSLQLAKEHYAKATALGAAPDASLERLIQ